MEYEKTQEENGEKEMSLDKAILHGKEHRKPYKGGKTISKRCRNHGGCVWCRNNRLHKRKKAAMKGL